MSKSHRKAAEKLPPKPAETVEFDAQTLHKLNFEIVSRLLKIWREYKDRKENRLKIFNLGVKLHGMVIDSIKVDPDIRNLKKIRKLMVELEAERDLFLKRQNLRVDFATPIEEQVARKVKELEATPGAFDIGPIESSRITEDQSRKREPEP